MAPAQRTLLATFRALVRATLVARRSGLPPKVIVLATGIHARLQDRVVAKLW